MYFFNDFGRLIASALSVAVVNLEASRALVCICNDESIISLFSSPLTVPHHPGPIFWATI
jgi:hypothetical protein